MKKILTLILAFCIVLVSAYAFPSDAHVWETDDGKFMFCDSNSYFELTNGNEACSIKYGDNIAESVCSSEYKSISGCGLSGTKTARTCSCIAPTEWNEPAVSVYKPHIWQKSNGNFVYCNGVNSVELASGNQACTNKYGASAWSVCNSYKTNQKTSCGVIDGDSRLCKCIFSGEEPAEADFTAEIITQDNPDDGDGQTQDGTESDSLVDGYIWRTEDNKYEICAGANTYIELDSGNNACTTKYGNGVLESACSSEYKQISGCGLTSKKARKCLCISPSTWTKPAVTVSDIYVWQIKDGGFMYCDGANQINFSDGNNACSTKYSRTSAWSVCDNYKTNRVSGCDTLNEARVCKCIFPSGTDAPAKADFSVSDITVPSETPSTPSSSGGGGGGHGGATTTSSGESRTALEVDIVNGVSRYLDLNNKGTFEFKGEKHEVYLKEIKSDSVIIVFKSEPIEVELKLEETKKIDIDKDGKEDLSVKLARIYNGMAEVLVKEITENIEPKIEEKKEEKKGMEEVTGAAVSKFNIKNYTIGATLILIAAIFVVLVIRIVKRDNKPDEL